MACKGCRDEAEAASARSRREERVFTFPFGPQAGLEVRTWGTYTRQQAAMAAHWTELMLQGVLVGIEPTEVDAILASPPSG